LRSYALLVSVRSNWLPKELLSAGCNALLFSVSTKVTLYIYPLLPCTDYDNVTHTSLSCPCLKQVQNSFETILFHFRFSFVSVLFQLCVHRYSGENNLAVPSL